MVVNRIPDWNAIQAREIAELSRLGEGIGYGRCIQILEQLWSTMLQKEHGFSKHTSDLSAGIICVWCNTDRRTGQVNKGETNAEHG